MKLAFVTGLPDHVSERLQQILSIESMSVREEGENGMCCRKATLAT